jgi:predicted nuclease with TOPRIM domain
MASEIDNLNEVIKMMSQELSQKIDEFHALGKKSKKEHDELEAQLSSNSEDFSARIENLQSELQEKSDQCTTFSQENTNLKSRITELEEVEVEKQKLIKNLAALKNKAKVCNIFYYRISNV